MLLGVAAVSLQEQAAALQRQLGGSPLQAELVAAQAKELALQQQVDGLVRERAALKVRPARLGGWW